MNLLRVMHKKIVFIFLLIAAIPIHAKIITGKVIRVADGDTLTILTNSKKQEKIRLIGIDAPERGQAFGTASRHALNKLCFKQHAYVDYEQRDRYGRILGRVFCNKIDANQSQVREGMAWVYRYYSNDKSLIALENDAKDQRLGLWQSKNPIPPWEFRRQ